MRRRTACSKSHARLRKTPLRAQDPSNGQLSSGYPGRQYRAVFRCEECGAGSRDFAAGWSAFYVSDPDAETDDERVLLTYCRACLTREFGGILHWLPRVRVARAG